MARVKPVSTMAKPACIKKTSAAPKSTQIVFTDEKSLIKISPSFFKFLHFPSQNKNKKGAYLRVMGDSENTHLCIKKNVIYVIGK